MKNEQKEPPKYLLDQFYKHLDVIFRDFHHMPFNSNTRLYNAYRLAKMEYYKLKKYKKIES